MYFTFNFTFDSSIAIPVIRVMATYKETTLIPAKLFFKVVNPAGVVIKDYSTNPDMTFSTAPVGGNQTRNLCIIPSAVGNQLMIGQYTLYVKQVDLNAQTTTEEVLTYRYCNPNYCNDNSITANLELAYDCTNKIIQLRDLTVISPYTLATRLIRLSRPAIPGRDNPDVLETASDSISDTLEYENVTYSGSLGLTIYAEEVQGDFTFTDLTILNDSAEEKISCGTKGCDLAACAKQIIADIMIEACKVGGLHSLDQWKQETVESLTTYLSIYNSELKCGNSSGIDFALDWLEKLLKGYECYNSIANQTGPKPINDSQEIGLGIEQQTKWVYVPESDLMNAVYLLDDDGNITDQIRYRRLATKHLEIQGGFIYTPSGENPALQTPILKNYFSLEMAGWEYATLRKFMQPVLSLHGTYVGNIRYRKYTSDNNFSLEFVNALAQEGDYVLFNVMVPVE